MLKRPLPIVNTLGLHARAAAKLVSLAATFKCRITIVREDTGVEANAKSILSVLHLAASLGTQITVIADGVDEAEAVAAIEDLFRNGFGEL
jgi:phosphocarrier protein HPr